MNLYRVTNTEQKALFNEAGIIVENREYTQEEINALKSSIGSYIFSKSKKEIPTETNRFMTIINIM